MGNLTQLLFLGLSFIGLGSAAYAQTAADTFAVTTGTPFIESFTSPSRMTIVGGGWEFGAPSVVGPTTIPEGLALAGTVLNGDYIRPCAYELITPPLKLPNDSGITLRFSSWISIHFFDQAMVDIQQGAGSWTTLRTFSGAGAPTASWRRESLSLQPYRNTTVRIRFRLYSSGSSSGTSPGWYLDLVKVAVPKQSNLILSKSGLGTVTPFGTLPIFQDSLQSITAVPGTGQKLGSWSVVSGAAVIDAPHALATNVTIQSDAEVRAVFGPSVVIPIDFTNRLSNFGVDNYSSDPLLGARFTFKSPAKGKFAVVVENVDSSRKTLEFFNHDQAFASTYPTSTTGNGTVYVLFDASDVNEAFYFKVLPIGSENQDKSFRIRVVGSLAQLTMVSVGSGTTNPAAGGTSVLVVPGVPIPISASPHDGQGFSGWSVVSGSAVIRQEDTNATFVTVNGDAVVRATFFPGKVYAIDSTLKTFNSRLNSFDGKTFSPGVGMVFNSPAAGDYAAILIKHDSRSASLSYYDSIPGFMPYPRIVSNYTDTLLVYFKASRLSQELFFKANLGIDTDFSVQVLPTYTLTTSVDPGGTLTPSPSVEEIAGRKIRIVAKPAPGFRFLEWQVVSGLGMISNTKSSTTSISLGSNVLLKAIFIPGIVFPVDFTVKTFDPITNDFDGTGNGVRLVFNPPDSGNYAIVVSGLSSGKSSSGYFYDTNSTFINSTNYQYSYSDSLIMTFPVKLPLNRRYFRIMADTLKPFQIQIVKALDLILDSDGNGIPIPNGKVAVFPWYPQPINAVANPDYKFKRWTFISGTGSLSDATKHSSTARVSTNATLRAEFKPSVIYPIRALPDTFKYVAHSYSDTIKNGVRFYFRAPSAGRYAVITENVSSWSSSMTRFNDYLGNEKNPAIPVATVSSTTANYHIITVTDPSIELYFTIRPQIEVTDTNYAFRIWFTQDLLDLNLTTDGNGTITPSGIVTLPKTFGLAAFATGNVGYRFQKWVKVTGKAMITDSTKRDPTITPLENATVRAEFIKGTIYSITDSAKSYDIFRDRYDDQSMSVYFNYVAKDSLARAVIARNLGSYWSNFGSLVSHGKDSSFISRLDSLAIRDSAAMGFANAGLLDTHYFSVRPTSILSPSGTFSIQATDQVDKVLIHFIAKGKVLPDSVAYGIHGTPFPIAKVFQLGYHFLKWRVTSGTITLSDALSPSPMITLKSDGVLEAIFEANTVYPILRSRVEYNFQANRFSDTIREARFYLDVLAGKSYTIFVDGSPTAAKYLYSYGTDSNFTSAGYAYSDPAPKRTITATSKSRLYFSVLNYYASDISQSFGIWFKDTLLVPAYDTLNVRTAAQGITVPATKVVLRRGLDSILVAIANSGFSFSKWTVDSGQVMLDDSTSPAVLFRLDSGNASIKPIFVRDTAKAVSLQITGVDLSNHPMVCVDAVAKDSSGLSVSGLDSVSFSISQDGNNQGFSLKPVFVNQGSAVSIVLDRSASMLGGLMDDAKRAANNFVALMGVFDRAALVTFSSSGTARVDQGLTSDKNVLSRAINGIMPNGGTAIKEAAMLGIKQVIGQAATKAVIILSDGADEDNITKLDSVIAYAKANNVVIYSIAVGDGIADPLKPMAERTGGFYTFANSSRELLGIYTQIKRDIETRYSVCYKSPDSIINGDIHKVNLNLTAGGIRMNDSILWTEDNHRPVIDLMPKTKAMVGVNQTRAALTIEAMVTDDDSIATVKLYYRQISQVPSAYKELFMFRTSTPGLFQGVISYFEVITPGIEFYIEAIDSKGLRGTAPNIDSPKTNPFIIPVGNRNVTFDHMKALCFVPNQPLNMPVVVTDVDGIKTVLVATRGQGESIYTDTFMNRDSSGAGKFSVTLNLSGIKADTLEYYFSEKDSFNVTSRSPSGNDLKIPRCDRLPKVLKPVANRPSGNFQDSICVTISDPTFGASLNLSFDGSMPDTSSRNPSIQVRCMKESGNITALGVKNGMQNSDTVIFTYNKISKLPAPTIYSSSNVFFDSLCFILNSVVTDAFIKYSQNSFGSPLSLDSAKTGTQICVHESSVIRAWNTKLNWVPSDTASIAFSKRPKLPKPISDKPSGVFRDSACITLRDSASGSSILVSTDGIIPDTLRISPPGISKVCFVEDTKIIALATKANWYASDTAFFEFKKMLRLPKPNASPANGLFRDSLCVDVMDDEQGSSIFYQVLVGGKETKKGLVANKGKICLHTSATLKIRAEKTGWVESDFVEFTYEQDVDPPRLISASIAKGEIPLRGDARCGEALLDTLKMVFSEAIPKRSSNFPLDMIVKVSSTCRYEDSRFIHLTRPPLQVSGGMAMTYFLDHNMDIGGLEKGDCLFLNRDTALSDNAGNAPDPNSVIIKWLDHPGYIKNIRAYPTIVGRGLEPSSASCLEGLPDGREWLEPLGFNPSSGTNPNGTGTCSSLGGSQGWKIIPSCLSAMEIVSTTAYDVNVKIYNSHGAFMHEFSQSFGKCGELTDPFRQIKGGGFLNYLPWNLKKSTGDRITTGVYIWKMVFRFHDPDGIHTQESVLNMGYMDNQHCFGE